MIYVYIYIYIYLRLPVQTYACIEPMHPNLLNVTYLLSTLSLYIYRYIYRERDERVYVRVSKWRILYSHSFRACANSTSNPSGYALGIWLPVSHAPSCIGTTNPSRTGLNPLIINRVCIITFAQLYWDIVMGTNLLFKAIWLGTFHVFICQF